MSYNPSIKRDAKTRPLCQTLEVAQMNNLLCKKCGSRNAFITTKGRLEKTFGAPVGAVGLVHPTVIVETIRILMIVVEAIRDWLKDENTKYVVCSECGHYEKL